MRKKLNSRAPRIYEYQAPASVRRLSSVLMLWKLGFAVCLAIVSLVCTRPATFRRPLANGWSEVTARGHVERPLSSTSAGEGRGAGGGREEADGIYPAITSEHPSFDPRKGTRQRVNEASASSARRRNVTLRQRVLSFKRSVKGRARLASDRAVAKPHDPRRRSFLLLASQLLGWPPGSEQVARVARVCRGETTPRFLERIGRDNGSIKFRGDHGPLPLHRVPWKRSPDRLCSTPRIGDLRELLNLSVPPVDPVTRLLPPSLPLIYVTNALKHARSSRGNFAHGKERLSISARAVSIRRSTSFTPADAILRFHLLIWGRLEVGGKGAGVTRVFVKISWAFPIDFRRGFGGLPARRKLEGGERRIKTEQPTNRTNPIPVTSPPLAPPLPPRPAGRAVPRNPHRFPRNLFPTRERKTILGLARWSRGAAIRPGPKENARRTKRRSTTIPAGHRCVIVARLSN